MPITRETDSRGMPHARNSRDQLSRYVPDPELTAKRREALRLYMAGNTFAEIAEIMQIGGKDPRNKAGRWVREAVKTWPGAQGDADAWREKINGRLDELEAKALEKWLSPGPAYGSSGRPVIDPATGSPVLNAQVQMRALEAMIRIQSQRARLNGANAPEQVSVKVDGELDVQLEGYIASFARAGDFASIGKALAETIAQARTVPGLPAVPGEVLPGAEAEPGAGGP